MTLHEKVQQMLKEQKNFMLLSHLMIDGNGLMLEICLN